MFLFYLLAAGFFTAYSRADDNKACKAEYCINLCCPYGYSYNRVIQERMKSYHRCDSLKQEDWICKTRNIEDLKWKGNWWNGNIIHSNFTDMDFYESTFECENDKKEIFAHDLFGEHELKLQINGHHKFIFGNQTHDIESEDLCLSFIDDEVNGTSIQPVFVVCHALETKDEGEKFQSLLYPVIIYLSSIFTILTLLVYVVLEDLRKSLYGKMMIGFLLNITIFYFFNAIDYILLEHKMSFHNSAACICIAYIKHHTFIAFFMWINIMSLNITYKFAHVFTSKYEGSILFSFFYAQGIPIIISSVLALVDNIAPCSSVLPNMGRFSCFVDSEFNSSLSFTETALFYYFYLIILIIVIINILCFIITGYNLTHNWNSVKRMKNSEDTCLLAHVILLAKIFLLMGIPWVLDIVSAALAYSQGYSKTIFAQFTLDVINLMTGILLFIILVCKTSVLESLQGKVRSLSLTETLELNRV